MVNPSGIFFSIHSDNLQAESLYFSTFKPEFDLRFQAIAKLGPISQIKEINTQSVNCIGWKIQRGEGRYLQKCCMIVETPPLGPLFEDLNYVFHNYNL